MIPVGSGHYMYKNGQWIYVKPVTYRLTVSSRWVGNPPIDPHTGNWFFLTHQPDIHLFQEGQPASQAVAETAMFGTVDGFPIDNSFSQTAPVVGTPFQDLTFEVPADAEHSQFSLVAMVAPSSDLFFGVDSVNLLDRRGHFRPRIQVPLHAFDAGSSPENRFVNNPPGTPIQTHDPIRRISDSGSGLPIPFAMAVLEKV